MSTSDLISFYKQLIQHLENGELNQRQIQTVIRSKRFLHKDLRKQRFNYDHCYEAAAKGDLDELKLMHQAGFNLGGADGQAAMHGHIDCLRYAHENAEVGWFVTDATKFAAGNGHLDCLKYAFENGCKIDSYAIRDAALKGHLDCLRFAYENFNYESQYDTDDESENESKNESKNEKKWTEYNRHCNLYATTEAAIGGNLDCLKFVHENGCPWNEYTIYYAVEQLKPLKTYNGSFWNDEKDINEAIDEAKEKRILDCLRYAIENGCPYDTKDEDVMKHINQLKRNIETTKNIIKNVELNDNVVDHIINKYI